MSLNAQLQALFDSIKGQAPPPVIEKALAIFKRLRDAGLGEEAPKAGDKAPDVQFKTLENETVALSSLLASGPVVLVFYRGRWCPFCDLTLRAFEKEAAAFEAAGARLIAVSPQTVVESQLTASERGISMQLLSDFHNAAGSAFGVVWSLTEEEKQLYKSFNSLLDAANGDDRWQLPAPAIFVIDRSGVVRWSHVDPDHTRRPEPGDVLETVKALRIA